MFHQLHESQEGCTIKWQHVSISPKKSLKFDLKHLPTKIQVKINVFCGKISHSRDKKRNILMKHFCYFSGISKKIENF